MKLCVFASHDGTTLQAIIDAFEAQTIQGEIVLVISNNSNAKAITRAQNHNIKTCHLSRATHPDATSLDCAIVEALEAADTDWVLLAGFMKKLGSQTLARFGGKILNIHPSLLPKYGGKGFLGKRVHEAVFAAGDTITGATVHQVDGEYDSGPVVAQLTVPVNPEDSVEDIEERVKHAEKKLLVTTLAKLSLQQTP